MDFIHLFLIVSFFLSFIDDFIDFVLEVVEFKLEHLRQSDCLEVNLTNVFTSFFHDALPMASLDRWVRQFLDEGQRCLEAFHCVAQFDEGVDTIGVA